MEMVWAPMGTARCGLMSSPTPVSRWAQEAPSSPSALQLAPHAQEGCYALVSHAWDSAWLHRRVAPVTHHRTQDEHGHRLLDLCVDGSV